MAAYVITYLEVTDPEAFQAYRKVAGPTFAPIPLRQKCANSSLIMVEGVRRLA